MGPRYWRTRSGNYFAGVLADAVHGMLTWLGRNAGITGRSRVGRRFARMGTSSRIAFPAGDIVGASRIAIGDKVLIGANVTLAAGMPAQSLGDGEPIISIGDRTTIGRGCHFVGLEGIDIANDVTFAPNVYVTDHNHTYGDVRTPIGLQVLDSAPVSIGRGCWIATNAVILPGAQVGEHVTVAAGAVVRGVVPPFSVVAGAPAVVVRQWTEDKGWDPPLRDERVAPPGWPVGYPTD
jgi:acetyltransferase-like isoleucine patch superfamily enzyme